MPASPFPRTALLLGLAGWAPQLLCLLVAWRFPPCQAAALTAGCLYAAVILSFLGGLWWMSGLQAGTGKPWILVMAVLPSLVAWAALLPLAAGGPWPGPSSVGLGLGLLFSPLVDRAIARHVSLPAGWLLLRGVLSTGLGLLTLALAA
jgi:hypothetical protein